MKSIQSIILVFAALLAINTVSGIKVGFARDPDDTGVSAGQSHTIDALTDQQCEERLNYTEYELERQIDYFSRNLNPVHFENALKILQNLTENHGYQGKVQVHTWELYD